MNLSNLKNFKLIVTSGPTREWIDPVRFISNPSSGKTGYLLAKLGTKIFKETIYIAGYTKTIYNQVPSAKNIQVDTTQSMAEAVFQELDHNTILIMAAAPADYTPVKTSQTKLKKTDKKQTITLKPTIDILQTIGKEKLHNFRKLILIGFAAETDHIEEYAKEKLFRKNAHFICANQVYKNQKGFGEVHNTIQIYDKWGSQKKIGPLPKEKICEKILEYLNQRIAEVWNKI